ncbi:MAG: DUF4412 domain-containing protein [Labilithrix sp.]|nr:DUF4412 domain-containing protein [Labilithrix sp.]
MKRIRVALIATIAVATSTACDKIQALTKKSDEAGAGAASGGVLSFLGGTFEGEIAMKVSGAAGKGGPTDMVFSIKAPKIRVDASGGAIENPVVGQGAAFIIDPPTKKGYALFPAQKKAMLIDFDKAKQGSSGLPGSKSAPSALTEVPTIEKTGKKEVIAGYECENWKVTSKSSRADMCVAEGIKWVDLRDLGMGSPEVTLAAAATEANRFPLRVIGYDAKGAETSRMEATKIDKKTLDASRFVVPPDYQVIDMSALLGGMGAPGGKLPPGFPTQGLPTGFTPPKPK